MLESDREMNQVPVGWVLVGSGLGLNAVRMRLGGVGRGWEGLGGVGRGWVGLGVKAEFMWGKGG